MSQSMSKVKNGWDGAIEDAKEMLTKVEAKARRLRTSISTLQEARDSGEIWPGETATQN